MDDPVMKFLQKLCEHQWLIGYSLAMDIGVPEAEKVLWELVDAGAVRIFDKLHSAWAAFKIHGQAVDEKKGSSILEYGIKATEVTRATLGY